MAASNYERGRRFEYRTRDKLLGMGAVYVMRAAQSKGAADLAAFWPPVSKYTVAPPWLVQCKTGSARMSKEAKRVLAELATACGASAVLAEPGKNGRGVIFTRLPGEETDGRVAGTG